MSEQPKPKAVRKPRVKKEVISPIALTEDVEGKEQTPVILFATEPATPVEKKPRAPRKPRITTPAPIATPVAEPVAESPAESPAPESPAPESPAEEAKQKKPRAPRTKKKEVPAAEPVAEPAAELAAEAAAEPTAESAAPEPVADLPAFDAAAIDCYCSGCRQTKSADKFGLTKRGKTRKTCVECSERVRVTPPPYQYNRLKGKVVLPENCTWENFGITWSLKLKTAPELALTLRDLLDALSPANMVAVEL